MSDVAIRVEGLGKQYRLGGPREQYSTLRDQFRKWTSLRGLLRRAHRAEQSPPFWALKDVSFDVKPGEVVGIIGRNGAGKSTLLKILSRITEPTEGGADIHGRVGSLLEVGTGFHPELTGRENVYLNGAIMGMKRAEIVRKFDEIVAFAEVEKFIDTPVKHYSSGMYMRLAFAVAAHLDPEILIVDEVLAVGDAQFQKKCLGKLDEVAHGGRTVMLVSHNLGTVSSLCGRVIWLEQGRVRAVGKAWPIVAAYVADTSTLAQAVINLDALTRRGEPDPKIRLISLVWETGLPLRFGEIVRMSIRMIARADVDEIAVGVGFSLIEGQRFLTFESDLLAKRVRIAPGGEWTLTLTITDLPVSPGTYVVDLGIRSGDNFTLDYLPDVCRVEVIPSEYTPSNIVQFPNVGVRLPGLWAWTDKTLPKTGTSAQ